MLSIDSNFSRQPPSQGMPFHTFKKLQSMLFFFFVSSISPCMLAILLSTFTEHCEAFFKGMDLSFSPCSYPILLFIFTTANQRKFSFFFLLSIFSNESNARKSIVDRASQQGGNARTHPVDDEM